MHDLTTKRIVAASSVKPLTCALVALLVVAGRGLAAESAQRGVYPVQAYGAVGDGVRNVAIEGRGSIDGQGSEFWYVENITIDNVAMRNVNT